MGWDYGCVGDSALHMGDPEPSDSEPERRRDFGVGWLGGS